MTLIGKIVEGHKRASAAELRQINGRIAAKRAELTGLMKERDSVLDRIESGALALLESLDATGYDSMDPPSAVRSCHDVIDMVMDHAACATDHESRITEPDYSADDDGHLDRQGLVDEERAGGRR